MPSVIDRLARHPVRSIGEIATAHAERLIGAASADDFAIVPLSERRCLFYEVIVEALGVLGWYQVGREAAGVPFDLDDGTGRARIDVTGEIACALRLGEPVEIDGGDPRVARLLDRHEESETFLIAARTVRYREGVIATGDQVAAGGPALREVDPDAAAGYRDAATRLRLRGTRRRPVLLSNDPRALS